MEKTHNHQLIAQLFDAQPESVIWFQPVLGDNNTTIIDFEVKYCNIAAAKFLHVSKKEIIGNKIVNNIRLDKSNDNILFKQCKEVYETGTQIEFTYYNERRNKHFLVLRSKVLDGILSVTRDRTEQVKTEQKIQEQATLLKEIFSASINGIMILDPIKNDSGSIIDLQFLQVNKAVCDTIKLDEKSLLGKSYISLFPDAEQLFKLTCQVLKTGKPIRTEFQLKGERADRWLNISIVRLEDNKPMITFSDISAQKNSKKLIENAAKRLQSIIDTIPGTVSLYEPVTNQAGEIIDFTFKLMNHSALALINQKENDIIGKRVSEIFPEYKENGYFNLYKQTFENKSQENRELHYNTNGSDRWFDVLITRLEDNILITTHDFTRLKKLQLQLENSLIELNESINVQEQLKKLNSYKDEFLSIASHELKTPLTSIKAYNQLLEKAEVNNASNILIKKSSEQIKRLERLISDLLDVSKINSGHLQYQKEVFKFTDAVSDTISNINNTNIRHRIITENMHEIEVYGDRIRIEQVMYNLISNAVKYSPHAKEVVVRTEKTGNTIAFSVQDFGIGISEEHKERIFERFYRIDDTFRKYGGLGLGLYISKQIINAHDGEIGIKNNPDRGSTFYFTLPFVN